MTKTVTSKLVPAEKFGKDHASMLAYVETLTVDSVGIVIDRFKVVAVDKARLRCNPSRHPLHAVKPANRGGARDWQPSWGTQIIGGAVLPDYDDWDVLNDLEAVGLVEVLSEANGYVVLTGDGINVAARLRAHKSSGKQFREFTGAAWLS
jgi:hypothetical protein